MIFWALVRAICEETVDLYLTREEAEVDLRGALGDVPEWVGLLSVQPVDLGAQAKPSPN